MSIPKAVVPTKQAPIPLKVEVKPPPAIARMNAVPKDVEYALTFKRIREGRYAVHFKADNAVTVIEADASLAVAIAALKHGCGRVMVAVTKEKR